MAKQEKIVPVKGTRDFYPEQMARHNWIIDGWKRCSQNNGFVEYDGPIFEHLNLFTRKSGDAIAEELFNLTDRAGRQLAIRPEMTPTLARMVNQKINALSRPIKWFSVPRCCRAEKPQKGRLREFFQWNVDIIGSDDVLADAECIFTALDYLRTAGLTPDDIEARISSRAMLAALLESQGFSPQQMPDVYTLLDKRPKLSYDAFVEMTEQRIGQPHLREKLMTVQAVKTLEEVERLSDSPVLQQAVAQLRQLFDLLDIMGVADYCRFDISIVRGLAYYTGPVFEVFDKGDSLRAVCAGGRYDNLLAGLGGQSVSGTGFGMGDVVLEILLQERGLMGQLTPQVDFFVIDAASELFPKVLMLTGILRSQARSAIFSYKRQSLAKQMKQATAKKALFAIILGQETLDRNEIILKNMRDHSQQAIKFDDFINSQGKYR